jgi:hypothetical protein
MASDDVAQRSSTSDRPPTPEVAEQDIAPDGDVILVVGAEGVRLRVYSQCLRAASKVFRVMFGPDWSEGQALSAKSPKEVVLDDDDAFAMRIVCLVLHHDDGVPEVLTPKQIATIAVVSDKYDLAAALRLLSARWLWHKVGFSLIDMGHRAVAAFLLDKNRLFESFAMDLIMYWSDSYRGLLGDEIIGQFMTSETICKPSFACLTHKCDPKLTLAGELERRRLRMRLDLAEFLLKASCDRPNGGCSLGNAQCSWAKKRVEGYRTFISGSGSPSLSMDPLSTIVDKIRSAASEHDMAKSLQCYGGSSFGRSQEHEPLRVDETFEGKLAVIRKRAALCIDCLRAREHCKVDHD